MSLTCKRAIVAGGSVVLVGAVGIFFKTNVTHSWALAGPDSIIWTFGGFAIHLLSVSCYRVSWQTLQLCYCFFLCESMNFHPIKQFFQVTGARDQTTDPWITKPVLYPYNTGTYSVSTLNWYYLQPLATARRTQMSRP